MKSFRFLGRIFVALTVVVSGASVIARPEPVFEGLGSYTCKITTESPKAQRYFNQGLAFYHGFNHGAAIRAFKEAARLDPTCAMAHWGIALANGPHINFPMVPPPAAEAAWKELQLAQQNADKASPVEKALIEALGHRYANPQPEDRKPLDEAYAAAMREVWKQFPDDQDVGALFAEAMMDLRPWNQWTLEGQPNPGTEEIVATLDAVLKLNPNHPFANHLYIHAVEASNSPERALAGANRLAALAPAAGHIVHMPAHVYIRTGDYAAAVKTNEEAAVVDRAYIKSSGAQGIYPMMYYSHNLHFIAMCSAMTGDYLKSRKAAEMLAAHVGPSVKDMPPLEGFMTIPMAVNVRFHKWDAILAMKAPDAGMKTAVGFWHFARGMALAGKGRIGEAEAEYKIVAEAEKATPPDVVFQMPINNKTKDILKIAENVLGAQVALAKKDNAAAVSMLREAVAVQDTLKYDEPQDWFFPVRESLGGVLLMSGDAKGAEQVFRDDLAKNPRNPRSLFGLHRALKAQDRNSDAWFVEQEFRKAWKGGAGELKVEDLV